jgi:periplasmic protein TonB
MSRDTVAKRAVVGVAILAAHLGLVLLLAASGFVVSTLVQSVAVTFLQQQDTQPEKPHFEQPALRPIGELQVPTPEIVVPVEPPSPPITATAVEAPSSPSPSPAVSSGSDGSAVPEMSDVAYLVQPAPRYPPESRRIREQGLVILRVLIDESGHARVIEIYRSSGHPRLDEAARAAVVNAVFKPFMDGGVARASAAIVPIEFSLRASS